ncbi:MAG: DUF1816 domain-containing protein [Symploca sp. SIO3C6]|uniref:DUF1816 domain-containing protein n=1 Tax=Symploca sp. SIO1C4 TaxID=2607765 RepID=A0A6B3NKR5_9CYAN|nr:DUF1816 domain-containing protein [Symploca sp. SIO3C6]NER32167.1 DUF1816 domain-containing protein [Symploca sp. SIO1C4]NET08214.1 DUF1816 domain-containing protein [Symploca sp. SIO2B6]NET51644.1 DUF1816 domain-containing protein [Merismopedia sp. SIO2A8]
MIFLEKTEETFISTLQQLGQAWWIELITDNPWCTYYFGPFVSSHEAHFNLAGYIEDLEQEKAQITAISILRCQPKQLTMFKD